MQETSIVPMKIPEHAKLLETNETSQNFSSDYDAKTSTWIRWATGMQATGVTSGIFVNVPVDGVQIAGNVGLISMGVVACVALIGAAIDHKSIKALASGIKDIKKTPDYSEWERKNLKYDRNDYWGDNPVSTMGYRVRKSTAKSFTLKFWDPRRMLGGAVLSETLWYNPISDIYTLETHNLRMWNWFVTIETYAGRRKAMSDALKAL